MDNDSLNTGLIRNEMSVILPFEPQTMPHLLNVWKGNNLGTCICVPNRSRDTEPSWPDPERPNTWLLGSGRTLEMEPKLRKGTSGGEQSLLFRDMILYPMTISEFEQGAARVQDSC